MKVVLMMLISISISAAYAQSVKKVYSAGAIMPNGSHQYFKVYANPEGCRQYLRIAAENMWNIGQVNLNQKMIHAGDMVSVPALVSESDAYKFLGYQLCETCNVEKVIDKNVGLIIFTKSATGIINMIDVYWLDAFQQWCISITPHINQNYTFKSKKDREVFY